MIKSLLDRMAGVFEVAILAEFGSSLPATPDSVAMKKKGSSPISGVS
jgi:hypothetical protein